MTKSSSSSMGVSCGIFIEAMYCLSAAEADNIISHGAAVHGLEALLVAACEKGGRGTRGPLYLAAFDVLHGSSEKEQHRVGAHFAAESGSAPAIELYAVYLHSIPPAVMICGSIKNCEGGVPHYTKKHRSGSITLHCPPFSQPSS